MSGENSTAGTPGQENKLRRKGPKVRTGCKTCTTRYKKCDETRPACKNCTSSGWNCDGYGLVLSQNPNDRKLLPKIASVGTVELSVSPLQAQRQGSRHFEFFRDKTARNLSALFDEHFWNNMLLQIGQSEPTVWHAIVAISSLDEQCINSLGSGPLPISARRDALVHYNKAIGRLTTTPVEKHDSVEVMLVSCLLFVCVELLLQNGIGAMAHDQGGAKIIQGWKAGTTRLASPKSSIMEEDILPIFGRLELQVASFSPPPSLEISATKLSRQCVVKEAFSTFSEAKDALIYLWGDTLRFADAIAAGWIEELCAHGASLTPLIIHSHQLKSQSGRWKRAFEMMLTRADMVSLSSKRVRMVNMLKLQYAVVSIVLEVALDPVYFNSIPPEDCWDPYIKSFQTIVDLAEMEASYDDAARGNRAFALDLGIVLPLYMTAIFCREPSIRERVLRILSSAPRQEGFWDSGNAGKLLKSVIERGDSSG